MRTMSPTLGLVALVVGVQPDRAAHDLVVLGVRLGRVDADAIVLSIASDTTMPRRSLRRPSALRGLRLALRAACAPWAAPSSSAASRAAVRFGFAASAGAAAPRRGGRLRASSAARLGDLLGRGARASRGSGSSAGASSATASSRPRPPRRRGLLGHRLGRLLGHGLGGLLGTRALGRLRRLLAHGRAASASGASGASACSSAWFVVVRHHARSFAVRPLELQRQQPRDLLA